MNDETAHIATAAALLDDPYAALSQHLHGDGDAPSLLLWDYDSSFGGRRPTIDMRVAYNGTAWAVYAGGKVVSQHDTAENAIAAVEAVLRGDSTWRTRALVAEAEIERLNRATRNIGDKA